VLLVFVPADPLTGDPVDVGEPVEQAPHQYRVHRGGLHPELVGACDGPSRCRSRNDTILGTVAVGVRRACRCGALDRSSIPARPSSRYLAAHLAAVSRTSQSARPPEPAAIRARRSSGPAEAGHAESEQRSNG